jgi:hypothetical protein
MPETLPSFRVLPGPALGNYFYNKFFNSLHIILLKLNVWGIYVVLNGANIRICKDYF